MLAGRRVFPAAVALGGALILIALMLRAARARPSPGVLARGEVLSIVTALAVFLLLVRPLGFVAASTALFVISVRSFRRLSEIEDGRRTGYAVLIVAPVFCALVDLAFRYGLDLPLPAGTLWSWMR